MLKNIFLVLVATALPLKGMSSDVHLRLPEVSNEVLAPKSGAYTLPEIHEKTVGEQVDLQIAYQNLVQAQNKIAQARAQYFPYGLGTIGILYYLNSWNPLILVELVTSLPTKIYNVQKEKNLQMATVYSNKALALNIKNQIDNLYFTILKEEASLRLAEVELNLLETVYSAKMDNVALGLDSEVDLKNLELRILDARDIVLKFQSYLIEEKSAFNILIGNDPTDTLELQPMAGFLSSEDFSLDVNELRAQAIARAPEVVAANYVITAADKNRSSFKWSFLSFRGIGFGYWANMNVAGSQVKAALHNRTMIEQNISNQVYVLNTEFQRTVNFFENEQAVTTDSEIYYEAELARFHAQEINLGRLAESGILYVKDFAQMVAAHYNALSKLSDFERAINGKLRDEVKVQVEEKREAKDVFAVKYTSLRFFKFSLTVESDEEIESVEYVFDAKGWVPEKVKNAKTNFAVVYANRLTNALKGHANVTLKNGEVLTQNFDFNK